MGGLMMFTDGVRGACARVCVCRGEASKLLVK